MSGYPQIVVTLGPTGVNIQGPLNDKVLMLGMLELAKEAVLRYKPGGLVLAGPGAMPPAGNGENRLPPVAPKA